MTRRRTHSRQTNAVLAELLGTPDEGRYGYDLAKATGVASGTLYPILMRLEQRGLLEARWEIGEQRPRHVYRLTADGIAAARILAPTPAPRPSRRAAPA